MPIGKIHFNHSISQMKLSDLKTGEKGLIVKVMGHGGFRKRIVEMGFVKGKEVTVLQNAPLQDPVKYRIMGYEVSLRRDEAELIEVVNCASESHLLHSKNTLEKEGIDAARTALYDTSHADGSDETRQAYLRQRHTINVALVGNPNCGKTSLFNVASGAHERVGNYSGVTVDAKEGKAVFEGYEFNIVDLPGTYSLSAYSPEELYVRKQIIEQTPDIIINVIDAGNLERNLYLTTQLIDMNVRTICALNMFDEVEKRGDRFDVETLGRLFGVPMIPTSFKTGKGVDLLFHIIINLYEGADYIGEDGLINPEVAAEIQNWHKQYENRHGGNHGEDFAHGPKPRRSVVRHIHINHGLYVEKGIDMVKEALARHRLFGTRFAPRFMAIKLLEMDKDMESLVRKMEGGDAVIAARDRAVMQIKEDTEEDSETAIMDAKYGFIRGALHEAGYKQGKKLDMYQLTHFLDAMLTNKYLAFPLFLLVLYVMFQTTFTLGEIPMGWIESLFGLIGQGIETTMPDGPLKDMLIDGVIGGVGAVMVFLPQILILYAFISFMEDTGYMARAAFIMDRIMHKMGLHGKSFIPLIMGFGCNVPAIMATRTIESRRSRLITMLILPMFSCSARLPIYIMIIGTFFQAQYRSSIMISLYVIGILMAVLMSRLFSRFLVKGEDLPFVMELPPYRFPTGKAILRHTWEKGKQYLKKMGGIILVASIIIWALGYFPHDDRLTPSQQKESSYIGQIGKAVEPIFRAQGFDWKLDVGLIAGIGAKEIVATTMGVLYSDDESVAGDLSEDEAHDKYFKLRQKMEADGITPLKAFSFLLFVLLYFPCVATIIAIKNESAGWKWATFAAVYTTGLAWVMSALVYQIGSLWIV